MENKILGLHHITAIARNAKLNYDFYTRVLGLRLVKKTVNFDDPGTYHFYFGDEVGTPGSILTFFPWEGIQKGRTGTGMATEIGYSVPGESLEFWKDRFEKNNVNVRATGKRFGEDYITFEDPDGLVLTLIIPAVTDSRKGWETDEVNSSVATKGFHSITLTLRKAESTARILTDIFGYKLQGQESLQGQPGSGVQAGTRFRYVTDAVENAAIVDIIEVPDQSSGVNAGGTIHHIAFRVKDEETQMAFREKILKHGLNITPKIDRNYFFSLYFREPGGVLFEIATDNPGFSTDETVSELGKNLKLPAQYEGQRKEIEEILPVLQ